MMERREGRYGPVSGVLGSLQRYGQEGHDDNSSTACDIVLCTFTVFERESSSDDRKFLCKQNFSYLVVDEAHCLKNPDSQRYVNM